MHKCRVAMTTASKYFMLSEYILVGLLTGEGLRMQLFLE